MSEGPFSRWVASHKPREVSTPNAHRVCKRHSERGSYCGRTSATRSGLADAWADVVCADCVAAGRADGIDLPPIDSRAA